MVAFPKTHFRMYARLGLWLWHRWLIVDKVQSGGQDIETGTPGAPAAPTAPAAPAPEDPSKCEMVLHRLLIPLTGPVALVLALLLFVLALGTFLISILFLLLACLVLCCRPIASGLGPDLFDKAQGFLGYCLLTVLMALSVAVYTVGLIFCWVGLLIVSIWRACH